MEAELAGAKKVTHPHEYDLGRIPLSCVWRSHASKGIDILKSPCYNVLMEAFHPGVFASRVFLPTYRKQGSASVHGGHAPLRNRMPVDG